MKLHQKIAILSLIKEDMAKELKLPCSVELENVGRIFFISGAPFIELKKLKDFVNLVSSKHMIQVEIIDLQAHQFIGSTEHAKALFEAFGGRYWHDQVFYHHPWVSVDLWQSSVYDHDVWEEPTFDERKAAETATPLEKEDVLTALL